MPLPPPPRPPPGMAPGQPGAGSWGGGGEVRPPPVCPPPQHNSSNNNNNMAPPGHVATLVASVNQGHHRLSRDVVQEIRRLGDKYDIESMLTIFAACAASMVETHNVEDPEISGLLETCLDEFRDVVENTRAKLRGKRIKRE